jgi:hypothetical protein
MGASDRILSEFMDAWAAGARPRVQEYLERVPEAEREELAAQVAAFVEWAPTPAYSAAAREAILAEPAAVAAVGAVDREAGLWPALLPRLRGRLSVRELAARLAEALGVQGGEAKTQAYLERMEAGTLDPTGVSRRVLEALGRILGADAAELEAAGTFGGFSRPAFAAFRSDAPLEELARRLEVVADALVADSPEGFDEVDRLFRGGRDPGST